MHCCSIEGNKTGFLNLNHILLNLPCIHERLCKCCGSLADYPSNYNLSRPLLSLIYRTNLLTIFSSSFPSPAFEKPRFLPRQNDEHCWKNEPPCLCREENRWPYSMLYLCCANFEEGVEGWGVFLYRNCISHILRWLLFYMLNNCLSLLFHSCVLGIS